MDQKETHSEDVGDIDGIVSALYESISFPHGGKPDRSRLRTLYAEGAILVPAPEAPGHPMEVLDLEGFIAGTERQLGAGAGRGGFHERETERRVASFGAVTHLMSTYESRHTPSDPKPFASGVNSIQLARGGGRWWIVSLFWEDETPQSRLPEGFFEAT